MDVASTVHPTDHTLQAYGLGKLEHSLAESVSKHLEGCPSCQSRVAEISSDSFLGRLRDAKVRPESTAPTGSSLAGLSRLAGEPSSPIPPLAHTLPPGLVDHPDYEVIGELGRGGMGVVYLAWNKLMARKEVLKVISRDLMERRGVLERFLREIRNAAQLHHPNIVTAYSAFRAGESIVFAMEHVEGQDLANYARSHGLLPVEHACYFIYQAALGLQYAHEQGMVHRDIKPSNLILARQGRRAVVKVLDFGLAKATREGPVDNSLTREGQMLGTPEYIAPEQSLNAHKADIRADIYSLGCTLYCLLTGGPPFSGSSLYEILQAHHSMDATSLNLVRPEVPWELAALVGKMMAKEPELRFQTPGEVAQALKSFFKQGSPAPGGSTAELSQAGQTAASQRVGALRSVPPPALQAATSERSVPARSGAPESTQSESMRESLLATASAEPLPRPLEPALPGQGWPRRAWLRAAAGGVLLLGLVIAWAVVLRVKTSKGMIELVNLPKDAEVLVDGEEVAVTWPGSGKPAVVSVTPGKHKITFKKNGIQTSGGEVTVQAESNEKFIVRFVPATKLTRELPKDRGRESTENSIGMTLKLIPAGEFFMGSPDDAIEADKDEKPSHRVRISKPFYLGVYEVTQAQYEAVMGNNPSYFSSTGDGKDKVAGQSTDQHPVENVSWLDAVQFCNKLSDIRGRKPFYEIDGPDIRVPDWNGQGYRLPTEAEWEYACRANASTPMHFSFGHNPTELGVYGWFEGNSEQRTHPVSQKRPNGFGLYDMHGNVWEWCWDWSGEGYYNQSPADDPTGPAGASSRVFRGGSWGSEPRRCRSAVRRWSAPEYCLNFLGFRLALNRSYEIKDLSGTITSSIPLSKESRTAQPLGEAKSVAPLTEGPTPTPSGIKSKPVLKPRGEWTSPTTKMEFVRIKGGEFLMGSPQDDKDAFYDEKPQHNVRISPFYLGLTEVTQAQYETTMGNNPSYFASTGDGKHEVAGRLTGQYPVESVSWLDAVRFCNALSGKEGLTPFYRVNVENVDIPDRKGPGYRLPMEAEWEYACRANASTPTCFSFGDNAAELTVYGWFEGNSEQQTHPVSQKRPNGFGLYDMHGNVWEWCWDWYGERYYNQSPADDPTGPTGASDRVIRGGSWIFPHRFCRSADRRGSPVLRSYDLGFRLALNPSNEIKDLSGSITPSIPLSKESKTAQALGEAKSVAPLTGGPTPTPSGIKEKPVLKPRGDWTSPTTKMEFVGINGGEFMMGSPEDDKDAFDDEKPQHNVRISPFYLGVTEVTQALYQAVIGSNPSYFSSTGRRKAIAAVRSTGQYPVENVSWLDAVRFCNALSGKEGLTPFYNVNGENVDIPDRKSPGYRLPTEAEWEYACRAGTTGKYSFGNDPSIRGEYGWFSANLRGSTHPVGERLPNRFGLYDMHGNVWEWCSDGYAANYYKRAPGDNPPGASGASFRVIRGGSWSSGPHDARSAFRGWGVPGSRSNGLGFRLARGQSGR